MQRLFSTKQRRSGVDFEIAGHIEAGQMKEVNWVKLPKAAKCRAFEECLLDLAHTLGQ